MENGQNLSIEEAEPIIKAFVRTEISRTGLEEKQIAVGQKIDLQLLKNFMTEIEKINGDLTRSGSADKRTIDAVRIYFGISDRMGKYNKEDYDIVIVPVLSIDTASSYSHDEDYHKVYKPTLKSTALASILGNTLPCPNVCPNSSFYTC